jgi:hypothetical protein
MLSFVSSSSSSFIFFFLLSLLFLHLPHSIPKDYEFCNYKTPIDPSLNNHYLRTAVTYYVASHFNGFTLLIVTYSNPLDSSDLLTKMIFYKGCRKNYFLKLILQHNSSIDVLKNNSIN